MQTSQLPVPLEIIVPAGTRVAPVGTLNLMSKIFSPRASFLICPGPWQTARSIITFSVRGKEGKSLCKYPRAAASPGNTAGRTVRGYVSAHYKQENILLEAGTFAAGKGRSIIRSPGDLTETRGIPTEARRPSFSGASTAAKDRKRPRNSRKYA